MKNKVYGLILFNLLWLIISYLVNKPVLIDPVTTYINMIKIIPAMWIHLLASLQRILLGLFISSMIGVSIGIAMAYSQKLNDVLNPLVYFSYPIPKLALLPIVMLLSGIGESAKIIMIVLILVFQIIVSVRDAVYNIPKENYNIITSLGGKQYQQLKEITLPAILPELLTTLRIALGTAISVLFFTETYGTEKGMGYFIVDAWMRIDYKDMYAGIALLSILGFILFFLIDLADHLLCRWNKV
ncbi:MAG: ABC transporter permease [Candidatus Azobacteroides sp.]|nr:ABC transporter permease [Candidatus Azobacteroides sp.]